MNMHLKVIKPHGEGDQLSGGEGLKERQSEWKEEVEEC